jgi:hypothetical protein
MQLRKAFYQIRVRVAARITPYSSLTFSEPTLTDPSEGNERTFFIGTFSASQLPPWLRSLAEEGAKNQGDDPLDELFEIEVESTGEGIKPIAIHDTGNPDIVYGETLRNPRSMREIEGLMRQYGGSGEQPTDIVP